MTDEIEARLKFIESDVLPYDYAPTGETRWLLSLVRDLQAELRLARAVVEAAEVLGLGGLSVGVPPVVRERDRGLQKALAAYRGHVTTTPAAEESKE